MFRIKRFLASQRAAVALESCLAASFLTVSLAGVFEIASTLLVGDLLQRAANRVARHNALSDTAAPNEAVMRTQCLEAIAAEIGNRISFKLADSADGKCTDPEGDEVPADFCLAIQVRVYDNPSDMLAGNLSQGENANLGGDAKDIVVVEMTLKPQTAVLAWVQRRLVDERGLTVMTVMRNERLWEDA